MREPRALGRVAATRRFLGDLEPSTPSSSSSSISSSASSSSLASDSSSPPPRPAPSSVVVVVVAVAPVLPSNCAASLNCFARRFLARVASSSSSVSSTMQRPRRTLSRRFERFDALLGLELTFEPVCAASFASSFAEVAPLSVSLSSASLSSFSSWSSTATPSAAVPVVGVGVGVVEDSSVVVVVPVVSEAVPVTVVEACWFAEEGPECTSE